MTGGRTGLRWWRQAGVPAIVVAAMSSAGNVAVSIAVSRSAPTAEVGQYFLAFTVYAFAAGLVRATVTEAVLARPGDPDGYRQGVRRSLAVGLAAGLLVAPIGLAAGSGYLILLGLCLPGLLLYDYLKVSGLGTGRVRPPLAQEGLWLVSAGAAVLVAPEPLAVFGGWAVAGAAIGFGTAWCLRYPLRPGWSADRVATRQAMAFGGQFVVGAGSAQLGLAAVGALGGAAVLGAIGSAKVVLGPVTLLMGTVSLLIVPYLARRRVLPVPRRLRSAVLLASAVIAVAAPLAVGCVLLPDRFGVLLVGANWSAAQPLLALLGVEAVLAVAATVASAGHRVEQAGGRALTIASALGVVRVVALVAAASASDPMLVAFALVAMVVLSGCVWWVSYLRLLRTLSPVSAPASPSAAPAPAPTSA